MLGRTGMVLGNAGTATGSVMRTLTAGPGKPRCGAGLRGGADARPGG